MANKVKWLVNAQSMIEKMVNIEKKLWIFKNSSESQPDAKPCRQPDLNQNLFMLTSSEVSLGNLKFSLYYIHKNSWSLI